MLGNFYFILDKSNGKIQIDIFFKSGIASESRLV